MLMLSAVPSSTSLVFKCSARVSENRPAWQTAAGITGQMNSMQTTALQASRRSLAWLRVAHVKQNDMPEIGATVRGGQVIAWLRPPLLKHPGCANVQIVCP